MIYIEVAPDDGYVDIICKGCNTRIDGEIEYKSPDNPRVPYYGTIIEYDQVKASVEKHLKTCPKLHPELWNG